MNENDDTITIAGITLTRDDDDSGRDDYHSEPNAFGCCSFVWRYKHDDAPHVAGQWGCSLYFGPASVGCVEPTLQKLDARARELIAAGSSAMRQAHERLVVMS